jgi:hypothetical protein
VVFGLIKKQNVEIFFKIAKEEKRTAACNRKRKVV